MPRRYLTGARARKAIVSFLTILIVAAASPARSLGAETDWPRWYGAMRLGEAVFFDTSPAPGVGFSRAQQATGFSLGVDLGPRLSVEVAGDAFESSLKTSGRNVGEYGIFALVPQVKLRRPTGDFTPFVLGGVGVAFTEFNDRKRPGIRRHVDAEDVRVAVTIGAGVDYAISDDIAIGADVRYFGSPGHAITIDGRRRGVDLHGLIGTAALRLRLAPDGPPVPLDTTGRYYLVLRFGGSTVVPERVGRDLEARPENAAMGGELNVVYGVGLGWDVGEHIGVELLADGHEPRIFARGIGVISELAIYAVVPQLRLRYPLYGGRFVPYGVAGVGVSWTELNDHKPRGLALDVHGKDFGYVAVVGAGVEYFMTRNVAIGLEGKYQVVRGHEISVAGNTRDIDLGALLTSLGIRVYFGRGMSRGQ